VAKVKYILLLPSTYNDGVEVPEPVLLRMCGELFDLGGGYTIAGMVTGAFRMKDGSKQMDRSLDVWIGVDESDEVELHKLVGKFAYELRQEALYLERTAGTIEYIRPYRKEGES
jgi:hypothetical protein